MDDCSCKLAAPIHDIPHTVVDTRFVDGKDITKNFPGYYVEVRDENTVYHVSTPKGGCVLNSLPVARLPLYKENYDPTTMARYRIRWYLISARIKCSSLTLIRIIGRWT